MNSASVTANLPIGRLADDVSERREEVTRAAARLFAERGYHGTSLADLADELGIQKASLYHHIATKEDLLWEVAWSGAEAFHAALDAIPEDAPATEKIRLALRGHLRLVAEQLDAATVFTREWRALEGERRDRFVAERRRYEERIRGFFREGIERGELRTDLDAASATLLFLSAANWAYTWLRPGADTAGLADRFYSVLLDGMRGYATPG
jgi:AcrR family transcriptional regulator